MHSAAMFVVVASGTASFAFVRATPYLAGIITLVGLTDLVFDVSGKARLHATLRRRVYDLLAISENHEYPISKLREQAAQIYGDEPPCMHAANYIAFNGAMEFWHRPREYLYKIEWYHRWFRHCWSFASTKFKTFDEIERASNAETASQAA
jgi:hypothetical protein